MLVQNQKVVFQDIRNFLAGRALGSTRDETLLGEVMKCLFAKKEMLNSGEVVGGADVIGLARKYRENFRRLKAKIDDHEEILLDPVSIAHVDEKLSSIDLHATDRDPVGDLYECFIGSSIRGAEGQFFTPQNAGRWLVEALDPRGTERVIDPACGAGGFLMWAVQHGGRSLNLWGIEKDSYLASLARARTAIFGVSATVLCGNALSFESSTERISRDDLIGQFDVVLTNPPFGKNISSVSPAEQAEFQLGKVWRKGTEGQFEISSKLASKAPPQVLFVERVLSLLRDGGRAGMIVPESLLSSRSYAHVVQFLTDNSAVKAVIGMPESLFKHSGKGGTHTKTCLLVFEKGRRSKHVFMAEAKWCGHDSRGRSIPKDDLPGIEKSYKAAVAGSVPAAGFLIDSSELKSGILAPRYHEPSVKDVFNHLQTSHNFVSIQQLVDNGTIEISSGDEVGKLAYGEGTIPFIRTSDISGWEIKIDPKHCVSEEVYQRLRGSQDVQRNDILMVRDGTYLIGSCAIITEYDERIVFQSHIYKIRCLEPSVLSPFLLLAILSSEPVQRQIKSKTFTQDIIDSLGRRIYELVLPIPKGASGRNEIERLVEKVIEDRVEARELARKAKGLVVDPMLS